MKTSLKKTILALGLVTIIPYLLMAMFLSIANDLAECLSTPIGCLVYSLIALLMILPTQVPAGWITFGNSLVSIIIILLVITPGLVMAYSQLNNNYYKKTNIITLVIGILLTIFLLTSLFL